MKEIIISPLEGGQRFDKFLGKYLTGAGRSFLYKMLRKKNITLNGKKATGSELLKAGDSVKLFFSDETLEKFTAKVKTEPKLPKYDLNIIYEDEDVLFINKPAGMLSQKAKAGDVSLCEYIVDYVRGKSTADELRAFTPSVANRLDRNTSGIITAGKTLKGLQSLSESFKSREVDKFYLAIVCGEIKEFKSVTAHLLKDTQINKVLIYDTLVEGSETVKTEIYPLDCAGGYSLVKVKLLTGKTHQIRATLSHIGYPIVGDKKYVSDKGYQARRQMLHSYELVFDGKSYKAELPRDFKIVLEKLGLELKNYEK